MSNSSFLELTGEEYKKVHKPVIFLLVIQMTFPMNILIFGPNAKPSLT